MTPASPWSQTGTWELIMPPGVSSPAQSRLVSLRLPFEMFLLSFSSHFTCDHPLGVIHFVHIIRWCMKNKYLITHFVVICLGTEMSLQSLLGLKSGIEVVECLSAICNFPIHFHFPPKKKAGRHQILTVWPKSSIFSLCCGMERLLDITPLTRLWSNFRQGRKRDHFKAFHFISIHTCAFWAYLVDY